MRGPKSRDAVRRIFAAVAARHGRRFPEVFAARFGQTERACRNWLYRGIPEEFWPEVADLAGLTVADVLGAHDMPD
ncbi:MAG: hypothetical protein K2X87_09350 [Gemmataceae bacterium]|nr:hypothetical protein [Gemmataceae bacterium]